MTKNLRRTHAAEIDAHIAEIEYEAGGVWIREGSPLVARIEDWRNRQALALKGLAPRYGGRGTRSISSEDAAEIVKAGRESIAIDTPKLEAVRKKVAEIEKKSEPHRAEFDRRGGWHRYFLVANGNGHVHRERNCSTCYNTTPFYWLPALSDCDEVAAVAEHGDALCAVCFPDVQEHPDFIAAKKRREAEGQAAANEHLVVKRWGDGGRRVHHYSDKYGYGECSCGHVGSLTSTGKLRKHKTPKKKAS